MSQFIEGEITSGDKLDRVARERRKKKETKLIPKPADPAEFPGYVSEPGPRDKVRLSRPIAPWKAFENRVWLLLYRFGFTDLNGLQRLFITAHIPSRSDDEGSKFEVDVFGKVDDNIFAIECKTRETLGKKSLRETIAEIGHFRPRIQDAIRNHYQDKEKRLKVSFIIATYNIEVGETDMREAKDSGVLLWNEKDINYLEDLSKLSGLIGDAARYQLYAIMFGKQEIRALEVKEPAIMGKIGRQIYYSFLTTPENLLKIAYVHHRGSSFNTEGAQRIRITYQRLLKAKKLQEISRFIEDRYFPNSIIVNFDKTPKFERKSRESLETSYGILYLPNHYQSAWIIDGQHRLYGFAKSERRFKTRIPVVAFVRLKTAEQAKLFVEINEKQTPVESNLLWDLYSDIYEGSNDPKQIDDLTISNVVKILNDSNIALKGHIYIPSLGQRSAVSNITMTTLCEGIKRNSLISGRMFGKDRLDQGPRETYIAERIGSFFNVLADLYPDDWERGEKGFLRSNNGVAALLMVLRQTIKYFIHRDEDKVFRNRSTAEFESRLIELLHPLVDFLKADNKNPDDLRKKRGSAGQSESAEILGLEIKKQFDDFPIPPPKFRVLPKDLKKVTYEEADLQIEDTERNLRMFIAEKLREQYGDEWYEKGIPGDVAKDNNPKGTIEKFAKKHLDDYPYDREKFEKEPERKLQFAYLGNLKDIIVYGPNWPVFEATFGKQANLEKRFAAFIEVRDALQGHFHDMDPVLWHTGRGAIIWIRKCLRLWIEESK